MFNFSRDRTVVKNKEEGKMEGEGGEGGEKKTTRAAEKMPRPSPKRQWATLL